MCAHIFRGKQCKLPRISLFAICTALNSGGVFSKSHLTLLLNSTETDCSKLRVSISKLKQLQHLQQCSICNKANETETAKPSALITGRFKQHFHSHWDSPGIKSKETSRLRDALDTLAPQLWPRTRCWRVPGRSCPAWLPPGSRMSKGRRYLLFCTSVVV